MPLAGGDSDKGRVRQHVNVVRAHYTKKQRRLQEMTEREFYLNGIKELLEECQEDGMIQYIYLLLCRTNQKNRQEEETK
jgi:hypothetical protein